MSKLNEVIKKKQRMFIILLVVGIIVFSFLVSSFREETNYSPIVHNEDEQVITERYSGIGSNVDEDEIWRAKSSNEIDLLQEENEALKREIRDIRSSMDRKIERSVREEAKAIKKSTEDELNAIKGQAGKLGSSDFDPEAFKAELEAKFKKELTGSSKDKSQISIEKKYFTRPGQAPTGGVGNYRGADLYKRPEPEEIESLSFNTQQKNFDAELAQLSHTVKKEGRKEAYKGLTADEFIPSGSFVRALILGGVSAPTGGQAQDDPYPLFLEINGLAQMPNARKYDIKRCRIIGSGYGEVSSERVIARLEKMSCITHDERVLESKVQGYIYDETGKYGIRGKLVTKSGQMIANSIRAAIGTGIGRAFQGGSATYGTNAWGSSEISFDSYGKAAVAGLGEGFGDGMDRLAKYYIDLAEQMFPVVEVDAGRMVDVVFSSGVDLRLKDEDEEESVAMNQPQVSQNPTDKPVSQITLGDMARAGQTSVEKSMALMNQQMR
jgi:conjugal transfer pilus assembly protein TraB